MWNSCVSVFVGVGISPAAHEMVKVTRKSRCFIVDMYHVIDGRRTRLRTRMLLP
jgi:hypothetical protein